ncbi:MAG TPA: SDR family oxidoreductase [Pyrinomonadaceae bacterium]
MKILIVGGTGMLGHKAVQILKNKFDVYSTIKTDFQVVERLGIFEKSNTFCNVDVENQEKLKNIIVELKPEYILNAVGIIKQLESSKNVIKTLTINSIFPHRLAEYAAENGAKVITVSTDCVFRGDKGNYKETDVSDATDLYGKSKNLGELYENHCLTLRTSIIGREIGSAHSLVEWFLSNRGGRVKGFTNAIYSGFPTIVFAELIADLIVERPNLYGLYHVASRPINKYELIKSINEKFDANIEIEPFADFYIDRSLNSERFQNETGFAPADWEAMIERMAGDQTPYDEWRQ